MTAARAAKQRLAAELALMEDVMNPYATPEDRMALRESDLREALQSVRPYATAMRRLIDAPAAGHAAMVERLRAIQAMAIRIDEALDIRLDADDCASYAPTLGYREREWDAAEAIMRGEDRPCPDCHGNGYRQFEDCVVDCATCGGAGSETTIRPADAFVRAAEGGAP